MPVIINLALLALVALAIVLTHNPLFLLGLLALQHPLMPPMMMASMAEPAADEDHQQNPIGFTAGERDD
jgi:hypothetical protein